MSKKNFLRHDCDRDGCFNKLHRPKIEEFAECLPGSSQFGDIDGMAEVGGRFCLMEWKSSLAVPRGQELAFKAFTKFNGNIVFVVHGHVPTMQVLNHAEIFNGVSKDYYGTTIDQLKLRIKKWADWANGLPRSSI